MQGQTTPLASEPDVQDGEIMHACIYCIVYVYESTTFSMKICTTYIEQCPVAWWWKPHVYSNKECTGVSWGHCCNGCHETTGPQGVWDCPPQDHYEPSQ